MWLVVSNLSAFGNSGGDYGGCGSGYDGRQEPRVIDWVNGSELWQSGLTLMLGVFVRCHPVARQFDGQGARGKGLLGKCKTFESRCL